VPLSLGGAAGAVGFEGSSKGFAVSVSACADLEAEPSAPELADAVGAAGGGDFEPHAARGLNRTTRNEARFTRGNYHEASRLD
jgi:hypothetical protein